MSAGSNIRIYFDNNVLDFVQQLSSLDLQSVTWSLTNGPMVLYPSLDLIEEALGVLDSDRSELLPKFAASLLHLWERGRLLADMPDILMSEAEGHGEIFASNNVYLSVRHELEQIAKGKENKGVQRTIERIKREKQESVEFFRNLQENLRQHDFIPNKNEDFESFFEKVSVNRSFIDYLQMHEIKKPDETWRRIKENIERYPYWKSLCRAELAIFYRYYLMNPKQDRNLEKEPDLVDFRHLVYMTGLDWLITGDERLRETFRLVFRETDDKRALPLDEFLHECIVRYESRNQSN